MATRGTQQREAVETTEPRVVVEYGEFVSVNGANPSSVTGCLATMTRTGEGKFSGTLKRRWRSYLYGTVVVDGTGGGRGYIESCNPQTGVITIGTYTAADAADDQPGTIRVKLEFKDTSITRR
jgi:hypothetical protein